MYIPFPSCLPWLLLLGKARVTDWRSLSQCLGLLASPLRIMQSLGVALSSSSCKLLLVITPLSWWHRWYRICLQCRRPGFNPWIRKSPWRRKWEPTPVFLPGEYHGQEKPGGLQSMGSQSRTRLSHSCPGITLVLKSLCQAKLTVRMIWGYSQLQCQCPRLGVSRLVSALLQFVVGF